MRITWGILVVLSIAAPARAQDDAADPTVLTATPAEAPGATAEAACKAIPFDANDEEPWCSVSKMKPKLKAKTPYQGFALVDRENSSEGTGYLAIQMNDQWHLAPLTSWSTDGADNGGFLVKKAQFKDVIPGGAPEILLTGEHSQDNEDDLGTYYGNTYHALWVCSVGASGAPSCVEVPVGQDAFPHPDNGVKKWKFRLSYKFGKDGRITRKLKGKWPKHPAWGGDDDLSKADYVNTRTLSFP